MKILHLFKSEPGAGTRHLVDALSQGRDASEAPLFDGPVDYEELTARIFESDQVVCWW